LNLKTGMGSDYEERKGREAKAMNEVKKAPE